MPRNKLLHPPKPNHPWKSLANSAWRKKTQTDAATRAKATAEFDKIEAEERAEEQASKGQSHDDYHDDYAQLQSKNFQKHRTQ